MTRSPWEFTRAVGTKRRDNLETPTTFAAIAAEVRDDMDVLCCHKDPCDRGPRDDVDQPMFWRPVCCIRVPAPLFDRFYNGWHGYRAAYFRSPFEGLAANDLLLRTLAPAAVASAAPGGGAALGREFIEASLTSLSAKAWLTEQNAFCDHCAGEFPPATADGEIINGRWELGASVQSRDGRAAPYLTKIKIMGAFLSVGLDEFIPARKRRRHWEIHEWGWS